MTYPPGQEIRVKNDGVGLVQSPDSPPLIVGHGKGLTPGQLYQWSNPNTAKDEVESGPVMETILAAIAKIGTAMVLAVAASTAATTSDVSVDRTDASTGVVAVSGTPTLDFDAKVQITRTGAKGAGRFRYTLDGLTWSAERIIPLGGTFVVPRSDLTLSFTGTPNNSAVTQTGTGPTVTVSGTPSGEFDFIIEVTTGGAVDTAQFKWSSDGGATYTTGVTVAATVALGATGITAAFTAGTYEVGTTYSWTSATSEAADFELGDMHSFTTTAPHYTTADLALAVGQLRTQLGPRKVRRVIFTGNQPSPAAAAAMYAAVAVHLADLESDHYFGRGMLDSGGGTADAFRLAFAAAADDRVAITYKKARCIVRDVFEGYSNAWQPGVRAIAERAFEADLSENLGRKASGPMEWVTEVEHDEGNNQIFVESDKIITFTTFQGETGFYVTNGYIRSPAGSDFLYWDWGVTIDELCHAVVEGQNKWLLSKLRALTDGSGNLSNADGVRIVGAIKKLIKSRLLEPQTVEGFKGHVSGVDYAVDLTNDFLATRTVQSTAAAVPLSPVEGFKTTIGLARSI